MVKEYFLVYLIYGFAMINMGIFCLMQNGFDISSPPLLKSLKYLGWFGIIHGISEWATLLHIANIYPEYSLPLFNSIYIMKAMSFAVLLYFGLDLLLKEKSDKETSKVIVIVLFMAIVLGFILLIKHQGLDYHLENPGYSIIAIRYGLALAGGFISSMALFKNSSLIERRKSMEIAKRYKQLALVIAVYGILEGLLVQKSNFFPANIINREMFYETFKFQILFLKATVGIFINYLLIKVIDTFRWEQEERLRKLEEDKIVTAERNRLGLEIHDSIIQMMYAAGLKVEYLLVNKDEKNFQDRLNGIKDDLNLTIEKTRELMNKTALDTVTSDELKDNIKQIVQKYNSSQALIIRFKTEGSPFNTKDLSPEKSTQIYYIVQEAISNVIKHSKATMADVVWEDRNDMIRILIIDNGIGIKKTDLSKDKHFGIRSMQERTDRIGGKLNMINMKKGLTVHIEIPWEDKNGK